MKAMQIVTIHQFRLIFGTTAAAALSIALVVTPSGRSVTVGASIDFVEIIEKVARLPCWIVDHSRCLSLDRFDPTCPQCM